MSWRQVAAILGLIVLVPVACSDQSVEDDHSEVSVVGTTSIWGDVLRHLVGDDAEVEVLIPVGADAHDYRASAQQVALLHSADLVVANGLGLEEGLSSLLEAAETDGANVFRVAPLLEPLPLFGTDANLDPHVWLDPVQVTAAADLIAGELAAVAPDVDWGSRSEAYAAELDTTNKSVVAILEEIPADARKVITNHDAFGYFADRYAFGILGVIVPGGSTLGEPSSAHIADLVETMRSNGIKIIFAETTQPSALALALAAEVGPEVEVVELFTESLGVPGSGADTLTGMLITNAELVASAFG